ncbi:MAG: flagellar filament capping protein FliD [Desulfuromonas sp.]|nr:flagellar filament capping protein FliD [Desulfuromonas sp.]
MADITFGGLATGLPTDDIVSQLMDIERQPIDRLEALQESEATRLQAFKQLDTRLEALREAAGDMNITSEVRSSSINLSSEDTFTASSTGASTGSYDVAVVQLAQVQKTVSGGFDSQTAALGTGTFTIGDETITLDESNNSLAGLRDEINALAESTGVHAAIINNGQDSNAYRLVLTGQDATTSFTASASIVDADSAALNFSLSETRSAQQAIIEVDGIEVVSDSNTVSGAIAGVTLHLNDVSEVKSVDESGDPVYATTLMSVEPDTATLKEKISTFVSSYNSIMDWISAGYDEFGASATSDEEIAAGAEETLSSVVRGDSTVNSVKRQLQNMLSTVVDTSGPYKVLSQLGISTQKDGSIELDESVLDTALESNFDDVVSLFAGEGDSTGVMQTFNASLLNLTGSTSGMYAGKEDSYDSAVARIEEQLLRLEPLMEKKESTMRARFSAMELLVSDMNTQSSFLTQQMDMLTNMLTGNS